MSSVPSHTPELVIPQSEIDELILRDPLELGNKDFEKLLGALRAKRNATATPKKVKPAGPAPSIEDLNNALRISGNVEVVKDRADAAKAVAKKGAPPPVLKI